MTFRKRDVARQRETPRLVERLAHELLRRGSMAVQCLQPPLGQQMARPREREGAGECAEALDRPGRHRPVAELEEDVGEAGAAFQRVEAGGRFGGFAFPS